MQIGNGVVEDSLHDPAGRRQHGGVMSSRVKGCQRVRPECGGEGEEELKFPRDSLRSQ